MTTKVVRTIRIDAELMAALTRLANSDGRSVANLIQRVLLNYVSVQEGWEK